MKEAIGSVRSAATTALSATSAERTLWISVGINPAARYEVAGISSFGSLTVAARSVFLGASAALCSSDTPFRILISACIFLAWHGPLVDTRGSVGRSAIS